MSSSWPVAFSMIGASGNTGSNGPTGYTGPSGLSVSYQDGNQPFSAISGSLLTLNTTPGYVYQTNISSTSTGKYIIMVNIIYTLPSGSNGDDCGIKFTVGRYTATGATSAQAINIVTNTSVSSSFPASPMGSTPAIASTNTQTLTVSGFAMDIPASAGTQYYTVWMYVL
jgi:hypothetical protein